MPIYDFRCRQCGRVSEVLFRAGSDKTTRCPDCGSQDMERLISSSYMTKVKGNPATRGETCCGRSERCEAPPCSGRDGCRRG